MINNINIIKNIIRKTMDSGLLSEAQILAYLDRIADYADDVYDVYAKHMKETKSDSEYKELIKESRSYIKDCRCNLREAKND